MADHDVIEDENEVDLPRVLTKRSSALLSQASFHSMSSGPAAPNYDLCVSLGAVPGSWAPLKFKKPKAKALEGSLPELSTAPKRYSPPAVASASLASLLGEGNQRQLCLFGGICDNAPVNETWLYDIEDKKWTMVQEGREEDAENSPRAMQRKKLRAEQGYNNDFPPARCGHNAVAVKEGKEMLVFGGANICSATYYNDLWVFDVELREWKQLEVAGVAPQPRWQSSAVLIEDRVFIYGGEGQQYNMLGDVNVYSDSNESWLKLRTIHPAPPPRMLHTATCVGDQMYVIGGRGKEAVCDTWCFEARTSMWTPVQWRGHASPFLTPDGGHTELYGHVAVPFNHCIVIHGGKLGDKFNNVTWALDTREMAWHAIETQPSEPSGPSPRWKHCATSIVDVQATPPMRDFTPLSELNLADEQEMAKWLQSQKEKLKRQQQDRGLLVSIGSTTAISSTQYSIVFGGATPSRRLADLWSFKLG